MKLNHELQLEPCKLDSNCLLFTWEFDDINNVFIKLVKIASEIPRTTVIESTDSYWHGVCRSLIFRFPDDLEILKKRKEIVKDKGLIQIKSASRVGLSDLGVNKKRIKRIYQKLMEEKKSLL